MKKLLIVIVIFAFYLNAYNQIKLKYPETKKIPHTDKYFGTKVEDDYQWMENLESQDVKDWVNAENKVTFDFFQKFHFVIKSGTG